MASEIRPLFQIWPELEGELGFLALGDFPDPIERLDALVQEPLGLPGEAYVKRDDLSAPAYGGNKVRTLEALFGQARRDGKSRVVATGAYGSNHAVATVLHARRVGFRSSVVLFPQPFSSTAEANLRVSMTQADDVTDLLHWSLLPLSIWQRRRAADALVMPPGGAIPRGCLGFMSAGLELSQQVDAGAMPVPDEVVLALGSTCSTAGLLLGLRLASRVGLGWGPERAGQGAGAGGVTRAVPLLRAVRVTPWPVTSPFRIVGLARRLSIWLRALTGRAIFDVSRAELHAGLQVDGSQLGAGYGLPTREGLAAMQRLEPFSAALDTTYSAKSMAALLDGAARRPAVRLFWSTKSSAPLPAVDPAVLAAGPRRMLHWLEQGAPAGAR